MPDEIYHYDHARQQWNYWQHWDGANQFGGVALAMSVLVMALLWFRPRQASLAQLYSLSYWVASWVLLNAFVTSTFAVVDPRLQSRVMWLLPLCAFLVLVQAGSIKGFLRGDPPIEGSAA